MNYFCLYYFLHICQTYNIAKESLNRQNVTAMHQTSVEGVDDMANLGDLHDAAILHNLHLRFTSDKIYVSFKSSLQKLLQPTLKTNKRATRTCGNNLCHGSNIDV